MNRYTAQYQEAMSMAESMANTAASWTTESDELRKDAAAMAAASLRSSSLSVVQLAAVFAMLSAMDMASWYCAVYRFIGGSSRWVRFQNHQGRCVQDGIPRQPWRGRTK